MHFFSAGVFDSHSSKREMLVDNKEKCLEILRAFFIVLFDKLLTAGSLWYSLKCEVLSELRHCFSSTKYLTGEV